MFCNKLSGLNPESLLQNMNYEFLALVLRQQKQWDIDRQVRQVCVSDLRTEGSGRVDYKYTMKVHLK